MSSRGYHEQLGRVPQVHAYCARRPCQRAWLQEYFQEMMQASPDVHAFTQDALSTAIVFCVYEPFSVSTVSRKSMTDCLPALRATSSGVRPEPSIAIGSISCSTTRYLHGDGSSGVSTLYAAPTRSRVDSRGTPPHGAAGDEALDWLT